MPLIDIPAIDAEDIPPDPGGVINALSRIGYSLQDALADLIDNSIDAGAHHVVVRFFRDDEAVRRIVIADDGAGMIESVLSHAMQFGARLEHQPSDLGKFGLGLKSASFSQCQTLSVVSRHNGQVSGRRWRVELIERGWICEKLDPRAAELALGEDWSPVSTDRSGTLVIWDDLDRLNMGKQGVDASLARYMRRLPVDLGLVYHRYFARGLFNLGFDTQHVVSGLRGPARLATALDPFGYRRSGRVGYPCLFNLALGDGPPLPMTAHIWPANAKDPQYKLGGGRVAARQGFYFYRNNRLIQAGGWNGWREHDAEPHSSLARVAVDMPPELDRHFSLNVQKSRVDVPPNFVPALEAARSGVTSFADYMRDAVDVYRSAATVPGSAAALTIGSGVSVRLQRAARRELTDGASRVRAVAFNWAHLDEDEFFRIDRDAGQIVLNRHYRSAVLQGGNASGTDAPLLKTLMFFAVERYVSRTRETAGLRKEVARLNSLLVAAARAQEW